MTYDQLVEHVSTATGVPAEAVKSVLFALPDALLTMSRGDMVRTPLGCFRMTLRSPRLVTPPQGGKPHPVKREFVVKLRPGLRIRKPA